MSQKLRIYFYFLLFCLLTFGILAPYLCSSLVYSAYFVEYSDTEAEQYVRLANERRLRVAEDEFHKLQQVRRGQNNNDINGDILIVVKTIDRTVINNNPYTGYLTQTVITLDKERSKNVVKDSVFNVSPIHICNTDPNPESYKEARTLSKHYRTFERWTSNKPPNIQINRRNREKEDYAFCLSVSRNSSAKYVLIVEDDAQPYTDFISTLTYVLLNRIVAKVVAGEPTLVDPPKWAYLRLYFPERWAGYSWEVLHLCELFGVGSISGTIILIILRHAIKRNNVITIDWFHFGLGFVYGLILVLLIGRQHVMELRRVLPAFFILSPANRCCTPAVIYPIQMLDEIIKYLDSVTCSSSFGVDLALDKFAELNNYERYLIQPNLFHHRGVYSTLTKPKIFKEFLFDS